MLTSPVALYTPAHSAWTSKLVRNSVKMHEDVEMGNVQDKEGSST